MKKIYSLFIFLTLIFSSCNYLDVVPDNVATLDYAFRDAVGAEKYLATCYSYLPHFGDPAYDPAIMGDDGIWVHDEDSYYDSYTGNFYAYHIKLGQQNIDSPLLNFWDGLNNGRGLFVAIRDCNIFLENINSVGDDLSDNLRAQWIAEVKVLKAFYHFYLMRMYGPIPIIRENLPVSATIDEVRVYREPIDDCVEYITGLIDEAVPDLPLEITDITNDLGHITQPAAMAVKAEILITAASPLFNGNDTYSNVTDANGTKLFSSSVDQNKWKLAMDACKNAIDTALLAGIDLYEFNDSRYTVSDETKRVMSIRNAFGERWNKEVIWGITPSTTNLQHLSMPYFTTNDIQISKTQPILSPTLKMAELFYSENGVPISEDNSYDYENRYGTSASEGQKYYVSEGFETANLNQHREPRFYANLGFDGGIWFGNGRYKDVDDESSSETAWILNAKSGNTSGKTSSLRYSITGYYAKKYSHFETATTTTGISYVRIVFPLIRLADLYLLYAEARNEYSGPDEQVYYYLDLVRERAGLDGVVTSWANYSSYPGKPSSQSGLREIIQQERMIELAFEGQRFWDLRRWKLAGQELNEPVKGWNVVGTTTSDYYNVITYDVLEFKTKEYLWPLRETTLRENTNLIQNPYWGN